MLRTFCTSVRLRTDRIEKELGFSWRYPDVASGLPMLAGLPCAPESREVPAEEQLPPGHLLERWTVAEALAVPGVAGILAEHGIVTCGRCPIAEMESLAEVQRGHGLPIATFAAPLEELLVSRAPAGPPSSPRKT
jgi:hypothetical protein